MPHIDFSEATIEADRLHAGWWEQCGTCKWWGFHALKYGGDISSLMLCKRKDLTEGVRLKACYDSCKEWDSYDCNGAVRFLIHSDKMRSPTYRKAYEAQEENRNKWTPLLKKPR